MKKHFSLWICALLLLCILSGCAAGASEDTALSQPGENAVGWSDYGSMEPSEEGTVENTARIESGTGGAPMAPQNRKIILTAYLEFESTDYDGSYQKIMDAAQKAGGYVSASSQTGEGLRRCELTLRIPAETYERFMSSVGEAAPLLTKEETSEDITETYVDVEARLKALKTQEASLLSLMEKAEKLEDVLALEERLSEVRYEIESYDARKRVYDDQTAYSTVHLSLREVRETRPQDPSFGERVSAAFQDCWRGIVQGSQQAVIGLIYLLPVLAALLAAVGIAIAIILGVRRKRRKKQPQAVEPTSTEEKTRE